MNTKKFNLIMVFLLRDYPDIPLPHAYFITYISDEEYFGNFIDLFEEIVKSLKPI